MTKYKNIYNFKPGDIITRMCPSKPIKVLGEEYTQDRKYMGVPLKFISIANNCAYVEYVSKTDDADSEFINNFFSEIVGIKSKSAINLPLDIWDDGWDYYTDPYDISNLNNKSLNELENEKTEALSKEDYERVKDIQEQIDSLKK